MAVRQELHFAELDELRLDPRNPRLGRESVGQDLRQDQILSLMKEWNLDELAESFLESGFFVQEALLVVREKVSGFSQPQLVVVEGNRRLASLMLLRETMVRGSQSKWRSLVDRRPPSKSLFTRIPYLLADTREDIEAFLGFRHVTGITEWHPAEKAEFIAKLIDERGMSYDQVRRRIGSKAPTVRQNYIAFNLLRQLEELGESSAAHVEKRFSILFLSLRTEGVRNYLAIDLGADPPEARRPVKRRNLKRLARLALWLFGDDDHLPVLGDSREIDDFGRVLTTDAGLEYLERTESPILEVALQKSGVGVEDLTKLINVAVDNVELVLSKAYLYKTSKQLKNAATRLYQSAEQLNTVFPSTASVRLPSSDSIRVRKRALRKAR